MERSQPYFIVQNDGFHFGVKCLILGNSDTKIGKICISRPLGMTPGTGT